MKSQLFQNEEIVIKHPTELHDGYNTISGIFYITNKRIVFEAHNNNLSNSFISFQFSDILSINKTWTKFMGFLPISFDSLTITKKTGNRYSFILLQREKIYNHLKSIKTA